MSRIVHTRPLATGQRETLDAYLSGQLERCPLDTRSRALRSEPNITALQEAWRAVIHRHEALRTTFEWKGLQQPVRHVSETAPARVDSHDWRHVAAADRQRLLERWRKRLDPRTAPLVHLAVCRVSDTAWQFFYTGHELILDRAGVDRVLAELEAAYQLLTNGLTLALPALAAPAGAPDSDGAVARQWWRSLSVGKGSTPLAIFDDRRAASAGGYQSVAVPDAAALFARLGDNASDRRVPELMQVAWATVLAAGGAGCVSWGEEVTGADPDEHSPLGAQTAPLPRALRIGASDTFADLLRQLAQQRDAAVAHRSKLADIRDWTGMHYFASVFRSECSHASDGDAFDSALWSGAWATGAAECRPLTLIAGGSQADPLRIDFDASRWSPSAAAGVARQLSSVLQAMARDITSSALAVTSAAASALGDPVSADVEPPCVLARFERCAAEFPERCAVVHDGQRATYRELNERANRLARRLVACGAGPEIAIGVHLLRTIEMVVAILAVMKAGASYVPLDPAVPVERLSVVLRDLAPHAVLTEGRVPRELCDACTWLDVRDINRAGEQTGENLGLQPHARSAAYVLYTSGSTGQPKGVVVEHGHLAGYVHAVVQRAQLGSCATFAMLQPLTVDSSVTVLYASLTTGGCLHLISEAAAVDATTLGAYFEGEVIDCLKIAPSHLAALHHSGHAARLMPCKVLIVGGEASRREWLATVSAASPTTAIFNHYGPTETTVGVLAHRFDPHLQEGDGSTVPLGHPLLRTHAQVLDADGVPVPAGTPGELCIGGALVSRGYLRRPSLTASQFVPDFVTGAAGGRLYRTGDLVRVLPSGAIEFLGRTDAQVKIRGFRIELGEIEVALAQHPAVQNAAVVAVQSDREPRLVACVVAQPGAALDPLLLRDDVASRLPAWMVPSQIVLVDRLPLTPHGKLDRRAVQAMAQEPTTAPFTPETVLQT